MKNILNHIPGLIFTMALAGLAIYAAEFPSLKSMGLSSAILAIVGGMLIGNTVYHHLTPWCAAGVDFTKQRILRLAIILFGLKLTLQDIAEIGLSGILIDATVIASTFMLTLYLGRRVFGLDRQSAILLGSGCSICGAAAILATAPVIASTSDKISDSVAKVSIAVSNIVIFGTIAMFIYPIIYVAIAPKLGISDSVFGMYIGSTIHEVAQVAGAGNAINEGVANSAVITKMIRVLMLAPFLIILSAWVAHHPQACNTHTQDQTQEKGKIVIPWFAVGFMLMAGISSLNIISPEIKNALIWLDNLLLTAAMAALGLTTHYSAFKKAGFKPLALAAIIFVWLILGGALINVLFHYLCG